MCCRFVSADLFLNSQINTERETFFRLLVEIEKCGLCPCIMEKSHLKSDG